jgi:hypothetical protein
MRTATATTRSLAGSVAPQSSPASRATYRAPATDAAGSRTEAGPFDKAIARFAVELRLERGPDLNDYERNLLEDFGRGASVSGEIRYRMKTLRSLISIASRSRRVELRDALPELLRAEILRNAPAVSIEKAFDVETPAPGQADPAQRAFERDPNPITHQRCKEALERQLAATRQALDAVLAWKQPD